MRKMVLFVLAAAVTLVVLGACSKGYESQKNTGGITITLKSDRYPLVLGDNTMTVKVADAAGKVVTDARVEVRFYMPPMPGMAPMETTTAAAPSGDKYAFTANAAMAGGWKADVTVTPPSKPGVSTTFNLDAR